MLENTERNVVNCVELCTIAYLHVVLFSKRSPTADASTNKAVVVFFSSDTVKRDLMQRLQALVDEAVKMDVASSRRMSTIRGVRSVPPGAAGTRPMAPAPVVMPPPSSKLTHRRSRSSSTVQDLWGIDGQGKTVVVSKDAHRSERMTGTRDDTHETQPHLRTVDALVDSDKVATPKASRKLEHTSAELRDSTGALRRSVRIAEDPQRDGSATSTPKDARRLSVVAPGGDRDSSGGTGSAAGTPKSTREERRRSIRLVGPLTGLTRSIEDK